MGRVPLNRAPDRPCVLVIIEEQDRIWGSIPPRRKRIDKGASTVTVFHGCRSTTFNLGLRQKYWKEHVKDMLLGTDAITPPVLLLDPITARQFIDRGGFVKKKDLIHWIHETARIPAGRYWDLQLVQNYVYPMATFGQQPMASWLKAKEDELIRIFPAKVNDLYAPSVDRLLISASEACGERLVAIIMTGMGDDGAQAIRRVRERGGRTIAESPQTAIIFGMPNEAIKTGCIDLVLPLGEIPMAIQKLCAG